MTVPELTERLRAVVDDPPATRIDLERLITKEVRRMTIIRRGGAAAGMALAVVAGGMLFVLPGCMPSRAEPAPAATEDRISFPGEPSEPQERAKTRLTDALRQLVGEVAPGVTIVQTTLPEPDATDNAEPPAFSGDRFGYMIFADVRDAAGRAQLVVDIKLMPSGVDNCAVPTSSGADATAPPVLLRDRRPDGVTVFGMEHLGKDGGYFAHVGAYRPDTTCVVMYLGGGAVLSGEGAPPKPNRAPLDRARLAEIAGAAELSLFPTDYPYK